MSKKATLVFLTGVLSLGNAWECPPNSTFEPYWKKCMCDTGYVDDGYGFCVLPRKCPEFSNYQEWDQKCVCWNGYEKNGDKCVRIPDPPTPPPIPDPKTCPWNNYYDENLRKCVACPENSLWNPNWR
jgi:hypothetical protein